MHLPRVVIGKPDRFPYAFVLFRIIFYNGHIILFILYLLKMLNIYCQRINKNLEGKKVIASLFLHKRE